MVFGDSMDAGWKPEERRMFEKSSFLSDDAALS